MRHLDLHGVVGVSVQGQPIPTVRIGAMIGLERAVITNSRGSGWPDLILIRNGECWRLREILRVGAGAVHIPLTDRAMGGRLPGHQHSQVSVARLNARTHARKALASIAQARRDVVIWLCCGGSLRGFVDWAHVHHRRAAERLRDGLEELADHYEIA
jgi:hypothetical protein